MDSLSYLIQNNNEVIIDEKLLHDLEKEKMTSELSKNQSPKPARKYSPINKPSKKSSLSKLTKIQATNHNQESRFLNQEQTIQLLSSKIQSLKLGQKQMQQKYSGIMSNLRQQLNKRNIEYQRQCDQFNQVKGELANTKKDIASLISLLKQNTVKQVDKSKRVYSPGETKRVKGNNILGNSKSNKNLN